jgi:hypothetical protein
MQQIEVPGARSEQTTGLFPGPGEGQRGRPRRKAAPKAKKRRMSVAARRGEDETGRKDGLGRKTKNAGQLANPRDRKSRQLGPKGRARLHVEATTPPKRGGTKTRSTSKTPRPTRHTARGRGRAKGAER